VLAKTRYEHPVSLIGLPAVGAMLAQSFYALKGRFF
jgi:hypothetical protein